jgi:glutamate/tyrosine decarboxylase-like PLP-dependent enzyme
LQKATDMTGLGTDAIHWIEGSPRMDLGDLERRYRQDVEEGYRPFLVVGSAGTVSTGDVDPLQELSAFCKKNKLWFHVDGAYGAFAAAVEGASPDLKALAKADSVAVDPHKWLYAPLEAGCAIVHDPATLRNAFSYHPAYYNFEGEAINYYDLGPQNSRGFRALKIWLALQHAGATGYRAMIEDDIALAKHLFRLASEHPEIEALTHNLSITTLRYVPPEPQTEDELNRLNQTLLTAIEESGDAFLSNALVDGKYALRMCVVNFRTSAADMEALLELIVRLGRSIRRQTPAPHSPASRP